MNLVIDEVDTLEESGIKFLECAIDYNEDVAYLDALSIRECFNLIADLKYIADPIDGEYLNRPIITLSSDAKWRDCDDKAVCLMSCLIRRGIEADFLAVSEEHGEDVHHVVIKLREPLEGFEILDCTYPNNEFGYHNYFYKEYLL